LNEEARSKTNKLKKLRTMILQAKSELNDINAEHQRAKESLLESIRESTKDLKLQSLIINSYIPIEFQVSPMAPLFHPEHLKCSQKLQQNLGFMVYWFFYSMIFNN
jgi:hypothetical protein